MGVLMDETIKLEEKKKNKILEIFESCLADGRTRWADIHKDAIADKKFIQFAEQLINDDGSEQKLKGRPRFVINKLLNIVNSEANEQRKMVMQGKVFPVDNGADVNKAKVRQEAARGIERGSNAKYAYQYAGREALTSGVGAFRLDIEWISDKSFDKTLRVRRIIDATTVMAGPCIEPDYSDAPWFIVTQKSNPVLKWSDEYNRLNSLDNSKKSYWGSTESPIEYEFWLREEEKDTLYRFNNGMNVFKSQMAPNSWEDPKVVKFEKGKPVSRETVRKKWVIYRLKARDFVEEPKVWPGKYAGIFIVNGDEIYDGEGRRKLLSLCRYSKDSQRLYNYARQEMGRRLGFQPKAVWLAAIQAIPDKFKRMWDNAHEDTYGTLYYNDKDEAGREISRPQQIQPPAIDPNLATEVRVTDIEIKDTSGVQAENLAQTSNATSRVAIDAKRAEGETNTFHFSDNLAMAIQHCTRCIVDLLPKVINTPRMIRLVGEDDAEKVIEANKDFLDPKTNELTKDYYFSEEEEYDIGVSVGPSYDSKRREDLAHLMEIIRFAPPQASQGIIWAAVKNMDFHGSDVVAKIIRPPGVEADDGEEIVLPQEVQAKLAQTEQMQQALQQAIAQIKELQDGAQKELELQRLQFQYDLALQRMKNENDIQKEMIRGDVAIQKQQMAQMPQIGDEVDGYTYKGGDPGDEMSWEKAKKEVEEPEESEGEESKKNG